MQWFSGHINSVGTGLNASVRINNTTASTGVDWHLYSLNNGNFGLYNNTGGAYAFQVTSGGNVGIGTASPYANLDLGATGANNIILRNTTSAYNLGYRALLELRLIIPQTLRLGLVFI